MAHHDGTVTVSTSGRTRDEALVRACGYVNDATGEPATTERSGRRPHWLLESSRCEVVLLVPAAGTREATVAGVELTATFAWRDA